MPQPLKDRIDRGALERIAARFVAVAHGFPGSSFVDDLTDELPDLELKERIVAIARRLRADLPGRYREALDVVVSASLLPEPKSGDFDAWPLCTFVEIYGLDDPVVSLDAMEHLTLGFSCEFAIRPYLMDHRDLTFGRLDRWTTHHDERVRRLVSEGTRPRLPWGMRLPNLIADPEPGLAFLDALHRDPSPNVRRSVANHLNDVAKDHPDLAIASARQFAADDTSETNDLVRRGLRTLVKQGHPDALEILGFTTDADVAIESFSCEPAMIALGDKVELDAVIRSTSTDPQRLVVDYVVHHVKASGATTPKVFKWTTVELAPSEVRSLRKFHHVRPITTRRYHPGRHAVELAVAGQKVARTAFELRV